MVGSRLWTVVCQRFELITKIFFHFCIYPNLYTLRTQLAMLKKILFLGLALVASVSWSSAQIMPSPARAEGEGPYEKLIIRGVTLIDGTGAPPLGPVDIVVEKNRITQIQAVGYPGVPINENRRPKADEKTKVMDLTGHYLMPGLIDMHGHIGGSGQGTPAEYVFKLWMAHGITTVRDPSDRKSVV